jgi:hypothetical protein
MQLPHRTHRYSPKISLDQAIELRRHYAHGVSPTALAREYHLSKTSLSDVVKRRTYVAAVTLNFTDTAYTKLRDLAKVRGCTVDELVAMLVRAGIRTFQKP